jgi:hypothetical protein
MPQILNRPTLSNSPKANLAHASLSEETIPYQIAPQDPRFR